MVFDEKRKLNNGTEIPRLALGTWFIDDDKAADAVRAAVKIGYRHVDTAQAYGNERGVGEGVRTAAVPREKIFVTSKVAAENKSYASAARSIDETLKKTGLEYIDMMIIHSPQPWREVNQSENRYLPENRDVWRAMEDAVQAGKVRTIGVSNFQKADIENILAVCKIRPAVNQVLCHISNTPFTLMEYCRSQEIAVEAYSPVAHGAALKDPKISELAAKYQVSVPQLCIRYDWQLGTIVLPKTANPEHMRSNADIDFTISDEDMETLRRLDRMKDYGQFGIFPVYGGKL